MSLKRHFWFPTDNLEESYNSTFTRIADMILAMLWVDENCSTKYYVLGAALTLNTGLQKKYQPICCTLADNFCGGYAVESCICIIIIQYVWQKHETKRTIRMSFSRLCLWMGALSVLSYIFPQHPRKREQTLVIHARCCVRPRNGAVRRGSSSSMCPSHAVGWNEMVIPCRVTKTPGYIRIGISYLCRQLELGKF